MAPTTQAPPGWKFVDEAPQEAPLPPGWRYADEAPAETATAFPPPPNGWKYADAAPAAVQQQTPPVQSVGGDLYSRQVAGLKWIIENRPEHTQVLMKQYGATTPEELRRKMLPSAAEKQEERVQEAEKDIANRWFPNITTPLLQAGGDVASLGARILPIAAPVAAPFLPSEVPSLSDDLNRLAEAEEQALNRRDAEGVVPPIVKRGFRGALRTLPPSIVAGMAGGPYAAIGYAMASEADKATTRSKDAGFTGAKQAGYVSAQALVEGIPAAVMQRLGLGGMEDVVSGQVKNVVGEGIRQGLKVLGWNLAKEVPEEIVTELGHDVVDAISGKEQMSWEKGVQTVADTVVQTVMAMGMASGPSLISSAKRKSDVDRVLGLQGKLESGEEVSRKDAGALKRLGIVDLTGLPKGKGRTEAAWQAWNEIAEAANSIRQAQAQPQQEQTDAQQVEEATPPDAGRSTRVEAEVFQGTEPVGGEGVRGGGQEGGQVSETEAQVSARPPETQEEVRDSIERALGQGMTFDNWLRGTAEGRTARKRFNPDSLRQFWDVVKGKQTETGPTTPSEATAAEQAPAPATGEPTPQEAAQGPASTVPPPAPPSPPPAAPTIGPNPSDPGPYGIKHASMDLLRQRLGMAARIQGPAYTDQQALNDAMAKTPAEVDAAIARIGAGKGEGKLDNAMMLRRRVELGTALEAANARGDKVAAQTLAAELGQVAQANSIGGTKAGRELQSRKMVADKDMTLLGMTERALEAQNFEPLNQQQLDAIQKRADEYRAEAAKLEAQRDAEASARLEAETKLAEIEAKEKAGARRKRAAAKAERLKAERRRELYDAAEQAGVSPKALQTRAMEILDSDPKVQLDRDYNAAFAAIERATGLTPLVIRNLENRGTKERTGADVGTKKPVDINEYQGLDEKAPQLHREYPEFFRSPPPSEEGGAAQDAGTSVEELLDGLKRGRKQIPEWRDYIEEAAKSLNLDAGYWEAGGEVVGPPGEAAAGAPAAGKTPARKSARQRAAAVDKRQAAIGRLKAAWDALGTVGAVYDPKAEAAKQAELLSAAVDLGRAYLEEGVTRLSEFLAEARAAVAGEFDQLRPHLITAWNQLRASGEAPSPMVDPSDRAELGRLARKMHREYIEAGVPDRESRVDAVWAELQLADPNLTRRETMDAMSGYGDFKELSKDEISIEARKDRGQLQQLAKMQDLNNAIAKVREWRALGVPDAEIAKRLVDQKLLPKKSGIERRKPDDIERALQKDVNALKKQLPVQPVPSDQQLATAFSTAQTTIRNRIADLREALRLGRELPEGTKPAYSPQQQAQLDAMKKELEEVTAKYRKLFPTKTQRAKMDRAADKAAQAQWDEEGGQGGVKTQQQLVLEAAKVLDGIAKRMQEDLDKLRAEGWKKKPNAPPLNAPMLLAKRATIDAIKAQKKELLLLDPAKQADDAARADAAYTRALTTRLAKNEKRLAEMKKTGVITPKKPIRKLSPEQLQIKKRMADIAKEDALEVERIRWENLTSLEKSYRIPGTVFKGLKSLWGSFDLSFIGRQGLSLALAHPIKAVKAQGRSAGAFWSEEKAFEIQENIRTRKNALNGVYQRMKLELTGLDEAAVAMEEEYAVHWPEKIPIWGRGVRASGRAFVAQGNQQRADVADAMLASMLRKDPTEATDAELEIIGHYINAASWRGDVTGWEQWAVTMNNFFWTPRGYVGQFQHLLLSALWAKNTGKGTARVRWLIVQEYARELAGRAIFYGTAIAFLTAALGPPSDDEDGWSISLNPYSADFGKVRLGRRRIDVMGGLAQPTRFMFRETTNLINGFRKLAGAEISTESLKEMDKAGSIFWRFLGSKVAPSGSLLGEVISGETYEGDDLTAGRLAADIITPLSFREIYESMKDMGVPAGTALAVIAIFGFGGMTYKEKKKPVKGRRKLRTLRKVEPR
jgi:hypothetical protein